MEESSSSIDVKHGEELPESDIKEFEKVIRAAYDNEEASISDSLNSDDVYFFLKNKEKIVGVGRYMKVEGIKIGDRIWERPVWGRSFIAVLPKFRGSGLGKTLTREMVEYGQKHEFSQVGLHGKTAHVGKADDKPLLSDFYRKCGLEVDTEIGARFYAPKDGGMRNLAHANVSYFKGDPFIAVVQASNKPIHLPYSW